MASPGCAPPAFNNIAGRRSAVIGPGPAGGRVSSPRAQQPALPVIGYLSSGSGGISGERLRMFLRGLSELAAGAAGPTFIIDNRPGAVTNIGAETAVRAGSPTCAPKKRPAGSSGFPAVGRPVRGGSRRSRCKVPLGAVRNAGEPLNSGRSSGIPTSGNMVS